MIQIAATFRNAVLAPAALAPGGDAAVFGLSLAALLDAPGQPVAVPGNALPPTPVAPVSAAPSILDPGVKQIAPVAATTGLIETKPPETPASAAALPVVSVLVEPRAVPTGVPQPSPTPTRGPTPAPPSRIAGNPRPSPVRIPGSVRPTPLPVPRDDLPSQPVEARGPLPVVDLDAPVAVPNPALTAKPGDTGKQPTDLAQAPVAAPPPHPPFLARTTTKLAADLPVEPDEMSKDDTPQESADLVPASPPAAIPVGPPVPPDAMAATQVAVSPASPRTFIEAPVSTESDPASSLAPQRNDVPLPVAYDAPPLIARSTAASPELAAPPPRSGATVPNPAVAASVPAAVLSPEPSRATGERPHPVAVRQALSQPVDTTVPSRDDTTWPDHARAAAVVPAPEKSARDEAVAAVRSAAVAPSSVPGVGDAADGAALMADSPIKRAPARVAPRMAPGVDPATVVPMAATAAAARIADTPSPAASLAQPLPDRADAPATVDSAPAPAPAPPQSQSQSQSRDAAATAPAPSNATRHATVVPATARTDSAPPPAPAPASVPPVSAVSGAPAIAPSPSTMAQMAAPPLAPTPAPGTRTEDTPRNDGALARAPAPVALLLPAHAQPPLIAAGTTAPAFRLFAEAIHAARRDERTGDPLAPAPIATIDPTRATLPVGGGATLDMTDHRWPHAMIDRIEALRDAASASADADTSIRVVPAALGTIDVSVRRDGDTVHVHFNAEQAATRALLIEAQPRLAELAEARGLKLGQASVGAGSDQNAQRQPAQQPARIPAAPAPAVRDDETDIATTRVA